MCRAAGVWLALALLTDVASSIWSTLWPLRFHLAKLRRFRTALELYSPAGSNLDVLILSASRCIVLLFLVCVAAGQSRQRSAEHKSLGALLAKATSVCGQLLLLAKCIAIAVLAEGNLWPSSQYNIGIFYMFLPTVIGIVTSITEYFAAPATIEGLQQQHVSIDSEQQEPLLSKPDGGSSIAVDADAPDTAMTLAKLSAYDTPLLLVAFAAGAVAALTAALIPFYTGQIIDYASIEPDVAAFKTVTLKLLAVAFLCAVFTGMRGGLFTVGMNRLNVRIRTRLFQSLLRQEIGFFDVTKSGDITSRLSADTTTVADQVCLNLNVFLRSMTQAAVVLYFMFVASWRLTTISFVLVPVIIVISKLYGAYYRKLAKKVQTELAEANSVAEEVITSMPTVKAHAAELSASASYAARLAKFFSLQMTESLAYSLYMTISTFLPNVTTAVILFYGGNLVLEGSMSAGSLVSFMLYQQSLSNAFQTCSSVFSALSAAVGAADKVIELMHRQPKIQPSGALIPANFEGRLQLENVCFSYPGRKDVQVLNGLSMTIQPGEVVALVGPSGGGKSSIVKLLERYYLPSSGSVLIDGRDAGVYHSRWLRRKIALVSQEPVLYARSIRRNICYGLEAEDGVPADQQPSAEDVEVAAKLANAHEFISMMPDGYDSDCGERGISLSGGQKQRIAIARALVRQPQVLLADEATSALDAESERRVQEALDQLMQSHTVLIIAHRLSTIQAADRIVVVNKGKVEEEGSHDDLMEGDGLYSTLVSRQMQKSRF
ncbi:hypothetical protein WJX74_010840 [Apatococcus lobatus]|uniref:Uncharacterized protein n=1 Tax=Apatococcus lobatus TaxID=904363 RepID=A0AAW1RCL3_9CHLO